MRLALLSNVTVELLAGMLKKEHSLWVPSGFGAWIQTALAPPDDLREFDPDFIFLLLDRSHAEVDPGQVCQVEGCLRTIFPQVAVVEIDLADLADETGGDRFYDEKMWKLAFMPWSLVGLHAIADEVNRLVAMARTGRKKVLALDFDNTLWSGVIGEDGVTGIVPYEEFQREIKRLQETGVLLVALTKNNVAEVEPIWSDSRMALKKDDFVALRIDWNDKCANLRKVASELNLGTDSFVFVDDNPAERAQMVALCPEVIVPEFPAASANLPAFMRRIGRLYFPVLHLTGEDRQKTAQYQAESARRTFATGLSVEDYLKGLELWADVHEIHEDEIPRVAQLSQKTNQFNVCTNRYTVEDVRRFAGDGACRLMTVHAGDRFGEQGLVAFVLVRVENSVGEIVDWVMSCRTMNRTLEFAVENEVERALVHDGVTSLRATYRPTQKNAPVADLFDRFGFTVAARTATSTSYVCSLPRTAQLPHRFKVKGE